MTEKEILAQQAELAEKRAWVHEKFPDVEDWATPVLEPMWWGRRVDAAMPIDDKKVIVDGSKPPNESPIYGIVSNMYGLRSHEEMIHGLMEVCTELPEFGNPDPKVVLLDEGGKMRIDIIFPEVEHEIRQGDFINPRISAFNSYDLGWKARGHFGAFRLVCSNGLMIGKKWASFAKRHIESLMLSELIDTIRGGMIKFSEETAIWKAWAERQIDHDEYANLWYNLPFSEKEKEKIEELPEQGTRLLLPDALHKNTLNLWDFNSVVTQFVTHEIESEKRRTDIEPRIARTVESFHSGRMRIIPADELYPPEEPEQTSEGDNGNGDSAE
jgi:hypothetical protein